MPQPTRLPKPPGSDANPLLSYFAIAFGPSWGGHRWRSRRARFQSRYVAGASYARQLRWLADQKSHGIKEVDDGIWLVSL